MKLEFLVVEGKAPGWVEQARQEYLTKISGFFPFEIKSIKSPNVDRDSKELKRKKEGQFILSFVEEKDFLVLFDESGRLSKNSEDFSTQLSRVLELGKSRVLFCIGGPYGFDESVLKRAQGKWSLSSLTMNHWVASLTALEQIYRGLTILRGIPYHNR